MKTVEDYLIENKIYEESIAGHEVKLKLAKKTIVMTVDGDRYLIKRDGEVSPETEIRSILEDIYEANIRFCDTCGIPYDMGFMVEGGWWYCCQSCFNDELLNDTYGKDKWRETEDEGENGGFYEFLNDDGEWEDTGIFYTEWN